MSCRRKATRPWISFSTSLPRARRLPWGIASANGQGALQIPMHRLPAIAVADIEANPEGLARQRLYNPHRIEGDLGGGGGQKHDAAFDALSQCLKAGKGKCSSYSVRSLVEDREKLKDVIDILFHESEHFR